MYSLTSFAAKLLEAAVLIPIEIEQGIKEAAAMLEREAKATFGSAALAPNADATVARKGFDSPGIETGGTRDSITHNSDGHDAYIGSNDKRLKWLELGTHKTGNAWGGPNPPRPILGITAVKHGAEAKRIVGHAVMTAIETI